MTPSPSALAQELYAEYADRIDSDRLEAWLELFAEQSSYQIVPRENVDRGLPASLMLCTSKAMLRDRITALRHANEYNLHYDCHQISAIRLRPLDERTFELNANYAVFQTNLEGQSRLFSVGRYRDKAVLDGDRLLLTEKVVIVDTYSVPSLLATPL